MIDKEEKEKELEQIEEKLIREEEGSRKREMEISGKSVFEIKRIKEKREKDIDKNK